MIYVNPFTRNNPNDRIVLTVNKVISSNDDNKSGMLQSTEQTPSNVVNSSVNAIQSGMLQLTESTSTNYVELISQEGLLEEMD